MNKIKLTKPVNFPSEVKLSELEKKYIDLKNQFQKLIKQFADLAMENQILQRVYLRQSVESIESLTLDDLESSQQNTENDKEDACPTSDP